MTPKEKAKALINKFTFASIYFTDKEDGAKMNAKHCALIAVDEILNISYFTHEPSEDDDLYMNYWKQVKTEIEKL